MLKPLNIATLAVVGGDSFVVDGVAEPIKLGIALVRDFDGRP